MLVNDRYDDGGFSGGTLDRPALKRLLADVESRHSSTSSSSTRSIGCPARSWISRNWWRYLSATWRDIRIGDSVFQYKDVHGTDDAEHALHLPSSSARSPASASVTRSLPPEARHVDGRLGPVRIRGQGPQADHRRQAAETGSADLPAVCSAWISNPLARELAAKEIRNSYGHRLDKGALYKLLNNRVYLGEAVHKGTAYPGEHEAIVDRKLWDKVHAILKESPRKRGAAAKAQTPALLKGLIVDAYGRSMSPPPTRGKRVASIGTTSARPW